MGRRRAALRKPFDLGARKLLADEVRLIGLARFGLRQRTQEFNPRTCVGGIDSGLGRFLFADTAGNHAGRLAEHAEQTAGSFAAAVGADLARIADARFERFNRALHRSAFEILIAGLNPFGVGGERRKCGAGKHCAAKQAANKKRHFTFPFKRDQQKQ